MSNIKISSFDIFDTVLVRTIGSPESFFLAFGRRLKTSSLIQCSAEAFARLRAAAESRAFENAGGLDSEVTLAHIYKEVGLVLRLTETECQALLCAELQLESELLQPVPRARELLQAARDRGERVVFISDMYLGKKFIQNQLLHHGLMEEGDKVYVSCEYRKSKASRQLYREVLRIEGVEAAHIRHCGNHPFSDYSSARVVGMEVDPFPEGNLNRYEKILEAQAWATEGLSSALAGASRLARLTLEAPSQREKALRDVTAGVAAPLLIGFTLWTLKRAKMLGLKRLYFLARDGQVLLTLAQALIKQLDFDCELRYLYGSRQAWMLSGITVLDEAQLLKIFPAVNDVDILSVTALLARFSLIPKEVQDSLVAIGLTEVDWTRNLTLEERAKLRQALLEKAELRQTILARAREKRQLMMRYLDQEGLLATDETGIVDLGTGATLYNALASVLSTGSANISPPKGFYLSLREEVKDTGYGLPETYLWDARAALGFMANRATLVTMLECWCVADHGSTLGYHERDGRIEPILTQENNDSVMDWGFPVVSETLRCVAENLVLEQELVNPWSNLCEVSGDVYQAFWTHPEAIEAETWGAFPFEDGWGLESVYLTLARPYRWSELLKPNRIRHWWHEGAIAQSPWLLKALFKCRLALVRSVRLLKRHKTPKQAMETKLQGLWMGSFPSQVNRVHSHRSKISEIEQQA